MAKRILDEPRNIQLGTRVSSSMKEKIDESADLLRISSNEWVIRAIQEKLDREMNGSSEISDDELDARIEAVLTRMLEEKKRAK